eukprot:7838569-Karenia_brevis.AAC.1
MVYEDAPVRAGFPAVKNGVMRLVNACSQFISCDVREPSWPPRCINFPLHVELDVKRPKAIS